MKNNSRRLQTAVQCVGATGEIVLFLAGFFLGAKVMSAAVLLILARIIVKIGMSELMFLRHRAVIKEGFEEAKISGVRVSADGK
ncbi:MAG: hypothetical protein IMF13_00560 [Proteobacteria bacterium]|nr:hypothetical protein [Pseudomonadota bacterium]